MNKEKVLQLLEELRKEITEEKPPVFNNNHKRWLKWLFQREVPATMRDCKLNNMTDHDLSLLRDLGYIEYNYTGKNTTTFIKLTEKSRDIFKTQEQLWQN